MFIERVSALISAQGITRNKLLMDLQLDKSSFLNWERRGTIPSGDVIAKIADYFHVSTDYLLGRTDQKDEKNIPGDGDGLSVVTEDERQLLDDYRSLNPQGQEYIRQTMHMATQTYKKMPDLSKLEKQA